MHAIAVIVWILQNGKDSMGNQVKRFIQQRICEFNRIHIAIDIIEKQLKSSISYYWNQLANISYYIHSLNVFFFRLRHLSGVYARMCALF